MTKREAALKVVEENMRGGALSEDAPLDALGIDSLRFLIVVLAIEQAVGHPVYQLSELANVKTVGDLLAPLQED